MSFFPSQFYSLFFPFNSTVSNYHSILQSLFPFQFYSTRLSFSFKSTARLSLFISFRCRGSDKGTCTSWRWDATRTPQTSASRWSTPRAPRTGYSRSSTRKWGTLATMSVRCQLNPCEPTSSILTSLVSEALVCFVFYVRRGDRTTTRKAHLVPSSLAGLKISQKKGINVLKSHS